MLQAQEIRLRSPDRLSPGGGGGGGGGHETNAYPTLELSDTVTTLQHSCYINPLPYQCAAFH